MNKVNEKRLCRKFGCIRNFDSLQTCVVTESVFPEMQSMIS